MPDQSPTSALGAPPPGGKPQQPPMGVSPATGPTPNKGYEAAGLQQLGMIVKQLIECQVKLGTSDAGQAVNKAIGTLSKFVPSGSVSPAAEKNGMDQARMRALQQNQQMQALKAQSGGAGGPPGGQAQPAAGGQAQAA